MKENLKPCVYKLWEHVKVQPRTFVERSGELPVLARLNGTAMEPKGNQVSNGRKVSTGRPETG